MTSKKRLLFLAWLFFVPLTLSANLDTQTIIDSPTTITEPGVYCLSQDVTGLIQINADDVTIDLNRFTLTNEDDATAIQATGRTNIIVRNGSIDTGGFAPIGINLSGCNNVTLRDLFFTGPTIITTGTIIALTNCFGVVIEDSVFSNISDATFVISAGGGEGLKVSRSIFTDCTSLTSVFSINNNDLEFIDLDIHDCSAVRIFSIVGTAVRMDSVRVTNNSLSPSSSSDAVILFQTSSKIAVSRSMVSQNSSTNANPLHGFMMMSSTSGTIESSLAFDNSAPQSFSVGFVLTDDSEDCCILQCVSKGHSTGFNALATNGLVKECISIGNNSGYDGDTSNYFFSNVAHANSIGFMVGATAPEFTYSLDPVTGGDFVATGARSIPVTYWDNITTLPPAP